MQLALSISAEGTLAFSRVAHPGRESDWLFSIGTLREVIVCAWIALIGRQIRELTRKKVIVVQEYSYAPCCRTTGVR